MKLKMSFSAIALLFFSLAINAAEQPMVRFGIVTDLHYSYIHPDNPKHPTRMYKMSKQKMQEAVATFNQEKVDFIAVLGDNIDGDIESFAEMKPVYATTQMPVYKILGNHDFLDVYGSKKMNDVQKELGVKKPYFSVQKKNVRFIFLDSNDLATYSRTKDTPEGREAIALIDSLKRLKKKNAHQYNGTLSATQIKWMEKQMQQAQKKGQMVICFAHDPFLPKSVGGRDLRGEKIDSIMRNYSAVKAVLTGHHHEGSCYFDSPVKHYNLKGMIEGKENHYSIVSVFHDRLEIKGYGDQESITIKF